MEEGKEEVVTEEEESEEFPYIYRLPSEIRALIFKKIYNQKQLCLLRLVSKTFKDEIDTFIEFCIELDDRSPHFLRLLELRIKHCKIVHLMTHPRESPVANLFKFPKLIKILEISSDIKPYTFYYLLLDSSKTLSELKITFTSGGCLGKTENFDNSPTASTPLNSKDTLEDLSFPNLKKLIISYTSRNPSAPDPIFLGRGGGLNIIKIEDHLICQILKNRKMPQIETLKIEAHLLSKRDVTKFSIILLNFISYKWATLENFEMDLFQGNLPFPSLEALPFGNEDLETINFSLLEKVQKIKNIRLVNSTSIGVDIWLNLLENQKKLQSIEIDLLPSLISIFTRVIQNNCLNLVHVDLSDLTVWSNGDDGLLTPFDLSVFENCDNLKKLTLDRNATIRRVYPDSTELINFFDLPPSLEDIAINYFNTLSDELLLYFSGPKCMNLRNVSFTSCGDIDDYGCDGSILEKIIALPNLNYVEISSLNFTQPIERAKLNIILTCFGFMSDHSFFHLSKNNNNSSDSSNHNSENENDREEESESMEIVPIPNQIINVNSQINLVQANFENFEI